MKKILSFLLLASIPHLNASQLGRAAAAAQDSDAFQTAAEHSDEDARTDAQERLRRAQARTHRVRFEPAAPEQRPTIQEQLERAQEKLLRAHDTLARTEERLRATQATAARLQHQNQRIRRIAAQKPDSHTARKVFGAALPFIVGGIYYCCVPETETFYDLDTHTVLTPAVSIQDSKRKHAYDTTIKTTVWTSIHLSCQLSHLQESLLAGLVAVPAGILIALSGNQDQTRRPILNALAKEEEGAGENE